MGEDQEISAKTLMKIHRYNMLRDIGKSDFNVAFT